MKLDEEQVAARMQALPNWTREEKTIVRRFKFQSFPDSMKFANEVADIAEARNHHPFISIDYKVVTLRLTSWHAGGLTEDDFSEAAAVDAVYAKYQPAN